MINDQLLPDQMQATAGYRISASPKGSRFDEEEVEAVRAMLISDGHLADATVCARFEAELRDYLGAVDVVVTSSCTMALELVTRYLGLGAGDQVVAAPLTYLATTASLLDRGCQISWCDIDDDTLSMSPRRLRELSSPDIKAVYLTHYGGDIARIDEICALARASGAVVVEDCAHALGTTWHGRAAGTFGDFGCFSFHSLKNMSTLGTGGAIATTSTQVAASLRRLRHVETHADLVARQDVFGADSIARPLPVGEGHEGQAFTHDCLKILRGGTNAVMSDVAAAAAGYSSGSSPASSRRGRPRPPGSMPSWASCPAFRRCRPAQGYGTPITSTHSWPRRGASAMPFSGSCRKGESRSCSATSPCTCFRSTGWPADRSASARPPSASGSSGSSTCPSIRG